MDFIGTNFFFMRMKWEKRRHVFALFYLGCVAPLINVTYPYEAGYFKSMAGNRTLIHGKSSKYSLSLVRIQFRLMMNSDLSTAFSLLGIGMITVFVVLLLVVITGNLLIRVVNRLAPAPADDSLEKAQVAAITAAVNIFTEGKGQVTRIEKLN